MKYNVKQTPIFHLALPIKKGDWKGFYLRPLAFESSFSVNHCILFGYQARIFYFSFFNVSQKFEFYNLTIVEKKMSLRIKKFAIGKPALRSSMSIRIL